MIYTYDNITISQFSNALKNSKYVCTQYLPKFITDKLLSNIVSQHNKNQRIDTEDTQLIENYYKSSLYVRLIILQTLYRSLELKVTDEAQELYKHYMFVDFKGDFSKLDKKIKRLKVQFEAQTEQKQTKKFDFDEYVMSLEDILNKDISTKQLRTLPLIEKKAVEQLNNIPDGTK